MVETQGNRGDAPTRPAGATGDVEMGIVQPNTEPADKHMEEFFKEVSLIKVAFSILKLRTHGLEAPWNKGWGRYSPPFASGSGVSQLLKLDCGRGGACLLENEAKILKAATKDLILYQF